MKQLGFIEIEEKPFTWELIVRPNRIRIKLIHLEPKRENTLKILEGKIFHQNIETQDTTETELLEFIWIPEKSTLQNAISKAHLQRKRQLELQRRAINTRIHELTIHIGKTLTDLEYLHLKPQT